MGVAFRQLRVYVRLVIVLVVALGVGLVLVQNRGNAAPVWFFGLTDAQTPVNVVWLMLCTAAGTLISWWVLSLAWGLWRDMREVKRQHAENQAKEELGRRMAALDERERRLDEKLKRAIVDERGVEDE
jgi:uncharacterized membrane-anchored protein